MATQRVTKTVKTTTTRTTVRRRNASSSTTKQASVHVGRPKGSKDTKPRKTRSDKGKTRSTYAGKPTKSSGAGKVGQDTK